MIVKTVLGVVLLTICSFTALILWSIFPGDNGNPQGYFFAFIFQCIIWLMGLVFYFLMSKFVLNKKYKNIAIISLFFSMLYINVSLYSITVDYSFFDFWKKDRIEILKNYENLTLNDYKNSYHVKDVIVNNVVLYKFRLPENLYNIQYLDAASPIKAFKKYPIWFFNDTITHNNKDITWRKKDNFVEFIDTTYKIQYRIGKDGLNSVEDFYTGGGSEIIDGKEIRNSGVVDQNSLRIIVSKNNPHLEVHSTYGELMVFLLKWVYSR